MAPVPGKCSVSFVHPCLLFFNLNLTIMKKGILLSLLFSPLTLLFSQTSFVIDEISDPQVSIMTDAVFSDGKYYTLATHLEPEQPRRISGDLIVFDENGDLLNQYELGGEGYEYYQVLSIHSDTIGLIGSVVNAECSSSLVLSEYIISTSELNHKSVLPFCDSLRVIKHVRTLEGLDEQLFFEASYNYSPGSSPFESVFVATQNEQGELTYVFEKIYGGQHLSLDFAKTGYLLKTTDLMTFYDRQFNQRKQKYNFLDAYDNDHHNISIPFGNKFILDQVKKISGNPGQAIRLLDSNYYVKKEAIIAPDEDIFRPASLPPMGGVVIPDENTIWTTSNYGYSSNAYSSFYAVSRLNADLEIQCTHFGGFDKLYRIYGINAIPNDGAIIFGWKAPFGQNWEPGKQDIFAVKVTDNCELTTAIGDPASETISITAYPNPSINSITFDVNGFEAASLKVEIYNTSGSTLFSQKDLSYEIHVADLPAGQYFYRISKDKEILGAGSWVKK